ncbi:MAG: hypothetical protein VKJ06_05865 [Vampirovibrionales bacterium]|nr:hypothetical protein [Vampirovibrionales bacterium]
MPIIEAFWAWERVQRIHLKKTVKAFKSLKETLPLGSVSDKFSQRFHGQSLYHGGNEIKNPKRFFDILQGWQPITNTAVSRDTSLLKAQGLKVLEPPLLGTYVKYPNDGRLYSGFSREEHFGYGVYAGGKKLGEYYTKRKGSDAVLHEITPDSQQSFFSFKKLGAFLGGYNTQHPRMPSNSNGFLFLKNRLNQENLSEKTRGSLEKALQDYRQELIQLIKTQYIPHLEKLDLQQKLTSKNPILSRRKDYYGAIPTQQYLDNAKDALETLRTRQYDPKKLLTWFENIDGRNASRQNAFRSLLTKKGYTGGLYAELGDIDGHTSQTEAVFFQPVKPHRYKKAGDTDWQSFI